MVTLIYFYFNMLYTYGHSFCRRTKEIEYAWEDVKALFNGGSRKRLATSPIEVIDDEETSNQPVSGLFSSHHLGPRTPVSSFLPSPIIPHLRLPTAAIIPSFPPGFRTPLMRWALYNAAQKRADNSLNQRQHCCCLKYVLWDVVIIKDTLEKKSCLLMQVSTNSMIVMPAKG